MSKSQPKRIWVQVSEQNPFTQWWPNLCRHLSWPEKLVVEKWHGQDLSWPRLIDSFRSFTLFSREKVILLQMADKAIKREKNLKNLFDQLSKGPHHLVFQSEASAPKNWPFEVWQAPDADLVETDDKAIFRWIDAIQSQNLKMALVELDRGLQNRQHPLVFLQLIARHYRLGRLTHHALSKGLSEAEIIRTLKIPAFVFQKWARSRKISSRQWQSLFDRLHWADWQLKSGYEGTWILRKLSFDLIEIQQRNLHKSRPGFGMAQSGRLFNSAVFDFARA